MRTRLPSPTPILIICLILGLAPTGAAGASPPLAEPTQPDPGNCWFWGAASLDGLPLPAAEVREQLCDGPPPTVAQQAMGEPDGWSLTGWARDAALPEVVRDPDPVALDEDFAAEVAELAAAAPDVALAHFRNTSSGCTPEEGNPHPFLRTVDGAPWILQHNGNVNRTWLESLVGPAYLADHPPLTCPDDPVDSELIFILLAHRIEHRCDGTSAKDALREALTELAADMAGQGANLMISDGSRLWALRLVHSDDPGNLPLHLRQDAAACWLNKIPPNGDDEWQALDDLTLVRCDGDDGTVEISALEPVFDLSIDLDDDERWCDGGGEVEPAQVVSLRLRFLDPHADGWPERSVRLSLPDESPVRDISPSPSALSTDGGLSWHAPTAGGLIGNGQVTHLRWDLDDDQQRLVATALVETGCADPVPTFAAHWSDEGGTGGTTSVGLVCRGQPESEPLLNSNPSSVAGCACQLPQQTGPGGGVISLASALLLFLRRRP